MVALISSLRVELVDLGARFSRGQRELVRIAAALDESGEWALDGAKTCAHWIAEALDIEVCTAREWLRIGHALNELPLTDAAFASGDLSYSKIRAVTRIAEPENEAELVDIARRVAAGKLAAALAAWLARRETPEQTEERQQKATSLSWKTDVDGMMLLSGRLTPADAALLTTSVDTRVRTQSRASAGAWMSIAQQRAKALIGLLTDGGSNVMTEIVLHVRGDGCTLDDGTPIPQTVLEKIAPESFIRALIHDAERRPINASGRHRHPTARQKRVVHERDGGQCQGCGSTELLEYDHTPDFEISRRTVVDELACRCRGCHQHGHQIGRGHRRTAN